MPTPWSAASRGSWPPRVRPAELIGRAGPRSLSSSGRVRYPVAWSLIRAGLRYTANPLLHGHFRFARADARRIPL